MVCLPLFCSWCPLRKTSLQGYRLTGRILEIRHCNIKQLLLIKNFGRLCANPPPVTLFGNFFNSAAGRHRVEDDRRN